MLDMSARSLERVLYYEDYLVTDPGDTPLQPQQLLNEVEYQEFAQQYGDSFEAMMGAEALQKLLARIDLDEMMVTLEEDMENTKSKATR
ncbi:hypothetical protein SMA90_32115, partial [Escherichia coli]